MKRSMPIRELQTRLEQCAVPAQHGPYQKVLGGVIEQNMISDLKEMRTS